MRETHDRALGYSIDPEQQHVSITGEGTVTMAGLISLVESVAQDPSFRSHFTVALDLRAASYTADLADGDALAAVLRQKKADFQNRFAVVVPESLHVLAKLYCLIAVMGGFDRIRCFTSLDQARQWCAAAR